MFVIRWILFVILLFLLVYVFAANASQTVDLKFYGREFLEVGFFWIVAASFAGGLLAAMFGMGLREFRHRRELNRLRRQNVSLQRELADLRSLPLQDLTDLEDRGDR